MSAAAERSGSTIIFVSLLRAIAALCVVWDHLVGCWFEYVNPTWGPMKEIVKFITKPLAICEHFGFFGVSLFFLISGFIITHVAQREDRLTFGVKRLFRIYPAMIVSIILIPPILCTSHNLFPGAPCPDKHFTLSDQVWSAMLLDHLAWTPAVNPVTWSLTVEIMFYAICMAFLPFVQRRPRTAVAVELAIVWALVANWTSFGGKYWWMLFFAAHLPYLVCGQLIYYLWSGRIQFRDCAILSGVAYYLVVRGTWTFAPTRFTGNNSQMVSFAYAYGVFIISMLVSEKIRMPAALRGTAEISYSLYLWHSTVGRVFTGAMSAYPFALSVTLGVIATFAVSYLSWRFVERPSQDLARRLLAWWRPRPPAATASPAPLPRPMLRAA